MADLKSSVRLSSTWELGSEGESRDLVDILQVKKKTADGVVNQEDVAFDVEEVAVLNPQLSSTSCFIFIKVDGPSDYAIAGVEAITSSRNIEFYNGIHDTSGYMCTKRGTIVKKIRGHNMYSCLMSCGTETVMQLALKLVSVRGQQEALVQSICVSVAVSEGGRESGGGSKKWLNPTMHPRPEQQFEDLKYLMSESKATLQLPQLLSTLQKLQQSPAAATTNDMSQMMSLFRQIRNDNHSLSDNDDTELSIETKINDTKEERLKETSVNGDSEIERLEERLKDYIDLKVSELEERLGQMIKKEIESKLDFNKIDFSLK